MFLQTTGKRAEWCLFCKKTLSQTRTGGWMEILQPQPDGNNPLRSQVAHLKTETRPTSAERDIYAASRTCAISLHFFFFSQLTVAKHVMKTHWGHAGMFTPGLACFSRSGRRGQPPSLPSLSAAHRVKIPLECFLEPVVGYCGWASPSLPPSERYGKLTACDVLSKPQPKCFFASFARLLPPPLPPSHPVQFFWQQIRRLHHKMQSFL